MLNTVFDHTERNPSTADFCSKTPSSPINIWLVDDDRHVRTALQRLLGQCEDLQCSAAFHSPNSVLSRLASKPGPDVILLDIQMGDACGLDAIRPIKTLSRSTHVVMFTTFFDGNSRRRALDNGASGFLLKYSSVDEILDFIRTAHRSPVPHLKRPHPRGRSKGLHGVACLGQSRAGNSPRRSNGRPNWLRNLLTRMSAQQR